MEITSLEKVLLKIIAFLRRQLVCIFHNYYLYGRMKQKKSLKYDEQKQNANTMRSSLDEYIIRCYTL